MPTIIPRDLFSRMLWKTEKMNWKDFFFLSGIEKNESIPRSPRSSASLNTKTQPLFLEFIGIHKTLKNDRPPAPPPPAPAQKIKAASQRLWVSVRTSTHHWDDVGDAVAAVDDGARQRPLPHLPGRPGGRQGEDGLQRQQQVAWGGYLWCGEVLNKPPPGSLSTPALIFTLFHNWRFMLKD